MASKTDSVSVTRVYQALQLVLANNLWVGFGRTSTWGSNEPVPDINQAATTLDELQAVKKAETLTLVTLDPAGSIEFAGLKYRAVETDKASAIANGARFVYATVWLNYVEVPVVTFRQSGVFAGLQRAVGVSGSKNILIPSEILDVGYLMALNNRSPIPRETDSKEFLEFILEF